MFCPSADIWHGDTVILQFRFQKLYIIISDLSGKTAYDDAQVDDIAEKVLQNQLADPSKQKELINRYIEKININ